MWHMHTQTQGNQAHAPDCESCVCFSVKLGGKLGKQFVSNWRQNHPSSISARIERTSSIDSFSLRMLSFSSSWFAVAFTEMSANLLGNRIEVSSQLRAE